MQTSKLQVKEITKTKYENIAVIDTETNWYDKVMSIGIVISNSSNFKPLDTKYYIITPEYKVGGMFSYELDIESNKNNITTRIDAINEIIKLLNSNNVKKIFAYNANFDLRHLDELKDFYWHDIMKIAANKKYNSKITDNMECCKSGRLKRNYGVESIYRLLSNSNVCETHNGLKDAIDELYIMEMLNLDLSIYENNANIYTPLIDAIDSDEEELSDVNSDATLSSKTITLPNGLKSIDDKIFKDCTSLTSIIIPDSVTNIGWFAFDGCTSLREITLSSNIKNISALAFSMCEKLNKVYYNGSITDWCNIKFGSIDSNPMYYAKHFYLLNNEAHKYEEINEIKIPSTINKIGHAQFYNFGKITSVTIPEGVTTIEKYAFAWCESLKHITIPNSVLSIESDVFTKCDSLQYNSYDNAYYLGNDTNPYLVLVKAKNTFIRSCIVNENTKFIYTEAFKKCKWLDNITLPKNIISILDYAFSYCSSLNEITYNGSINDWKRIKKDKNGNTKLKKAAIHYVN